MEDTIQIEPIEDEEMTFYEFVRMVKNGFNDVGKRLDNIEQQNLHKAENINRRLTRVKA